jgi:anti-sigma B factor antagonist
MRSFVDLSLDDRAAADSVVVAVQGQIDVYTAHDLRDRLIGFVDGGERHLIVDLEGVEFLDSTGLGVLVGALKRVRAGDGSLQLVCSEERLLKIFRITGLDKVFLIHASVEAASS